MSPDGRWIAYAKQGKLRKVAVEGGPAIDLAPCDWAGGSWGRNGRLVYSPSYNTGLWIVSEEGGDQRMLTAPDTAKGELGHWWPQILDDGDHVVFTAYRTPIDQATIEVLSIRTGQRKVLLTGGVFGFYVPTGHLVYAAGEAIRAVPFDLKRLEVTGASVPVVDSVAMNATDGAAAFDVSRNGTLAYLPVSSYITETDLVLVDREGHETRALPNSDRYNHPRLSPDGSRIAVDIRSANALGDVWVFEVGRSGGTRVTAGGGRDFGPEWTPDGRELIYIRESPLFDLYRRAADASRPATPLLTGGNDHYTGSVSSDGRLLAYVLSVSGGVELWTVPLQGRPEPKRYLANGFNLAHPALSPDGRWMAYDSDESGRVEVYAQSFPDPSVRRWKISPSEGSEPMWTRNGRELVYRKGDSVMAVTVDLESGRVGQPRALFAGPYPDNPGWTRPRSYDVSRDGERFLMTKLPADRPRPRITVVLNWFDELRGAKVRPRQPVTRRTCTSPHPTCGHGRVLSPARSSSRISLRPHDDDRDRQREDDRGRGVHLRRDAPAEQPPDLERQGVLPADQEEGDRDLVQAQREHQQARAEHGGADVGEGDVPEGLPLVGVEILAGLLLRAVQPLEPGEDLGDHHRGQGRRVPEHHRPARHEGEPAREPEADEAEEGEQRDAGDDARQDERQQHQPPEGRLAGEVRAVEHEGSRYSDHQRDGDGQERQLEARERRVEHPPIVRQGAEPLEGAELQGPGDDRGIVEGVDDHDHERQIDEGEDQAAGEPQHGGQAVATGGQAGGRAGVRSHRWVAAVAATAPGGRSPARPPACPP